MLTNRFLILAASALMIVGFSTAADHGFDTPAAYAVIIVGLILLGVSIVHFLTTKRNAIIPRVRVPASGRSNG